MSNGVCGHSKRSYPRAQCSPRSNPSALVPHMNPAANSMSGGETLGSEIQNEGGVFRERNDGGQRGDPSAHQRKQSKHHRTPSIWFEEEEKRDEGKKTLHAHRQSEIPGHRRRTSSIDVTSLPLEPLDQLAPEFLETYEKPSESVPSLDLHVEAINFSDPRHSQMCVPAVKPMKPKAQTRPNSKRHMDENSTFQMCGSGFCPKCRRKVTMELGSQSTSRSKLSPKVEDLMGKVRRLRVLRCAQCLYVISKVE